MLLVRQEIAAGFLARARLHGLADFLVGQAFEAEQPPAELHVRHGLDVEYQRVHRRDFFRCALLRLRRLARGCRLEHGHGDDEPRLVGERDVPAADAELAPHLLAARRIDHLGRAPGVLHDADVADPDAMREAGAHAP